MCNSYLKTMLQVVIKNFVKAMGYHIILRVTCQVKPIYRCAIWAIQNDDICNRRSMCRNCGIDYDGDDDDDDDETNEADDNNEVYDDDDELYHPVRYVDDDAFEAMKMDDVPYLPDTICALDEPYRMCDKRDMDDGDDDVRLVCYEDRIYKVGKNRLFMIRNWTDYKIARVAPESFRGLLKSWRSYDFGGFYDFSVDGTEWKFRIEKKPYNHKGNLQDDYESLIYEILPVMTTQIDKCTIEHDDYDIKPTHFTDDKLRRAHYIRAVKPPEVPKVQYGKREKVAVATRRVPVVFSEWKVYPYIYDSDPETWPKELRRWWYDLNNKDNVAKIVESIREYYKEDEYLLSTADWLEKWLHEPDVEFVYSA